MNIYSQCGTTVLCSHLKFNEEGLLSERGIRDLHAKGAFERLFIALGTFWVKEKAKNTLTMVSHKKHQIEPVSSDILEIPIVGCFLLAWG
jgi:hypothetical protein